MAEEEMLDVYDSLNNHIGTETRERIHNEGLWHRTIHCWVVYADESKQARVVLQKRSEQKKAWPGYFDISAAGHLLAGETLTDGIREIEEEIGVETTLDQLISVGTRVCVEDFKAGTTNREFQSVFLLIDERALTEYKIQVQELAGLVSPKIDDLIALFRGDSNEVRAEGIKYVHESDSIEQSEFSITATQFIPSLDSYNHKLMILAKRGLLGETDLLI